MKAKKAQETMQRLKGARVEVTGKDGKRRVYSVKCFIPMFEESLDDNPQSKIKDVEVLLCRSRNHYFSASMFLNGESWARKIRFLGGRDARVKDPEFIANIKPARMVEVHWEQAGDFVRGLLEKSEGKAP